VPWLLPWRQPSLASRQFDALCDYLPPAPALVHGRLTHLSLGLLEEFLIVSQIALARVPSTPIGILELISRAKSSIAGKRRHALRKRVETAIRVADVMGAPRTVSACPIAE
jgi:hypothetical protein